MVWNHFSIIVNKYSSGLWKLYFKGHNLNSHFILLTVYFLIFHQFILFMYFKFLIGNVMFTTHPHSKFFSPLPLFLHLRRCFWERKIDRKNKRINKSRKEEQEVLRVEVLNPMLSFWNIGALLYDIFKPQLRDNL